MILAKEIRKRIMQFPEGKVLRYNDLSIAKEDYVAAAKALERLQKKGLIKKLSKGVFYKPIQSVFGELKPDSRELLRSYLFEDGKRVAYVTGESLYNRMGLTSQMAFRIKIASQSKRISINIGTIKADAVKSYAQVTEDNYKTLGLLDAFKDIKHIPDCSVAQAVLRLSSILKKFTEEQTQMLIKFALMYPPRVRALVGAVLENNGNKTIELMKLRESLNPLTIIKLGLKENELPTKSNWFIE